MSEQWGRADTAGTWPRPKPVWTLGLLLLALAVGGAVGAYGYSNGWTPLQRLFLSAYFAVRSPAALGSRPVTIAS